MHLDGFDLNLLVALNVLLEEKSVSKAADRLYLSQPAMSSALQRLREKFNDKLLVRTGQRMELTTLAQSLTEPVREFIRLSQSILDVNPEFNPSNMQRTFTILMSDIPISYLMREVMKRVTREAPGLEIAIGQLTSYVDRELDAGNIDFVIRTDRGLLNPKLASQALRSVRLFSDKYVCAVSEDHPTLKDNLTYEDYLQLPHLNISFGEGAVFVGDLALDEAGDRVRISATAPHFTDLIYMLPGTPLIATLPSHLARKLSVMIPLKIFDVPYKIPDLCEKLFWHERNDMEAGHLWLRQVIIDAALELQGEFNEEGNSGFMN